VTGQIPSQPAGPSSGQPPSWKLKPPLDALTQGIVVSGFSDLPAAKALFLMCDWPENGPDAATVAGKGAWLTALAAVAPITDSDGKDARAASLAFTWTGLQKSGLGRDALASFSAPFREGMYREDRLRRLGDRIKGKWQRPVIDGGPRWSGNTPVQDDRTLTGPDKGAPPRQVITPMTAPTRACSCVYSSDCPAYCMRSATLVITASVPVSSPNGRTPWTSSAMIASLISKCGTEIRRNVRRSFVMV
jgi:hypothetical protein